MGMMQTIEQDLKKAMIAKDEARLSTVRFLKSALKYAAIEKKVEFLNDADVIQIIQKQIKQRRESIDQFEKGGRAELAAREKQEVTVLESYLPKQLGDAELSEAVQAAIQQTGASSKKDFGRVMKILTEKLAGQAEAKRISDCLGKMLT